MKAIQIKKFGIDGLEIIEIPVPSLKPNEVLIRVKAASLNYLDLLVVKGIFNDKLQLPHIPITDVSGIVEQVGASVTKFKIGNGVIPTFMRLWRKGIPTLEELPYSERPALGMQGYLSEYIAVDESDMVIKPINYSYEYAATLPIAALSAWSGIKYLSLESGNSVLIYGTGGVSTFALLFAKAAGLKIFVAGRNDVNLAKMKELGAYKVYNVLTDIGWKEKLISETNGEGVKGIYESVGGDNINNSLEVIAIRGKITCVGVIQGFSMNVDAGKLLWKQASIIGIECGSTQDFEEMIEAIKVNHIMPVIDKVYEIERITEAFLYLEKGGHFGKIIIQL